MEQMPHHREGIQNDLDKAQEGAMKDNAAETKEIFRGDYEKNAAEIAAVRAEIAGMAKLEEKLALLEKLEAQRAQESYAKHVLHFPGDLSIPKKLVYFFTKGSWPSRTKEKQWDGGI